MVFDFRQLGRYEPVGYRGFRNGQSATVGTNTYTWSSSQDKWNLVRTTRPQSTLPIRNTTPSRGTASPVRGVPTDRGFDDVVRETYGPPILSGGGPSDEAIINRGDGIRPVSIVRGNPIINNDLPITRGVLEDIEVIRPIPDPPPPPLPVIRGCTDRKALNFNPRATVSDNSKCTYAPPKPIVKNTTTSNEKKVTLNFTSNRKGSTVFEVKGKLTGGIPKQFTLSGKELLTPKIFQAKTGSSNSVETYKIYSVQKSITKDLKPILPRPIEKEPPVDNFRFAFDDDGSSRDENALRFRSNLIDGNGGLPYVGQLGIRPFKIPKIKVSPLVLGKSTTNYFEIVVEKRTTNGKYVPVPISDKIDNKYLTINLPFELVYQILLFLQKLRYKLRLRQIHQLMVWWDIEHLLVKRHY